MASTKYKPKIILGLIATLVLVLGIGIYIGISYKIAFYETEIAGWNTFHTGSYITALESMREGDSEYGYRMLEVSLDVGEGLVSSYLNRGKVDSNVTSEAMDVLERFSEYRDTYPFEYYSSESVQ